MYQQDALPLLLHLHPSLCRAVAGAPGSQSPGRYHMQAIPHAGCTWPVRELLHIKQCDGPWASCWSPGSHPGHTLPISYHSPVPPGMSGAKRRGISPAWWHRMQLHLCVPGNRTNIFSSLCQHLLGTAVLIPLSLLFAVFILASVPPMNNTWSISAPAFAKGSPGSSSLHRISVCSMSFLQGCASFPIILLQEACFL